METTPCTRSHEPRKTGYSDRWNLIAALFQEDNVASIQINSYNDFIRNGIPEVISGAVIEAFDPVSKRGMRLRIDTVFIANASSPVHVEVDGAHRYISPIEARKRKLTYSTQLYCNMSSQAYTDKTSNQWETHENVFLADIPVMLKSCICSLYGKTRDELLRLGECDHDHGGYFICKGNEKVIVPQDRMSSNLPHTWVHDDPSEPMYLEIRSIANPLNRHSNLCMRVIKTNGKQVIKVQLPCVKDKKQGGFPLVTLLSCYGMTPDELMRIFEMFPFPEEFQNRAKEILLDSIKDDSSKGDLIVARAALSQNVLYNVKNRDTPPDDPVLYYLTEEILPHTEIAYNGAFDAEYASMSARKKFHLVYYTVRLLRVFFGLDAPDDRDDYNNKRIDTPGMLLLRIFKQSFNQLSRSISKQLMKDVKGNIPLSVMSLMANKTLTHQLVNCLATGNWGVQKRNSATKTGVSQLLGRMSYLAYMSDLRRVNASLGEDKKQSKKTKPRQLHITGLGLNCPAETPEGEQVGRVKNFSVAARITNETSPSIVYNILFNLNISRIESFVVDLLVPVPNSIPVLVNGYIYGLASPPEAQLIVDTFLNLRRNGYISYEVSMLATDKYINILSDSGRITRPLYTVTRTDTSANLAVDFHSFGDLSVNDYLRQPENIAPGVWTRLVTSGIVEYIDSNEAIAILLAAHPSDVYNPKKFKSFEYTHCELHPSLILGVSAGMIPYADFNQSPRNAYQSAMGKQAAGQYLTNHQYRSDKSTNVLHYLQKPLVATQLSKLLGYSEMPAGQNVIIAIMSYTGYNQEDSLIQAQSSNQRGMLTFTNYKTFNDEAKRHGELWNETFERPDPNECINMKMFNYDKLSDSGLPAPGTELEANDVIIGKTCPTRSTKRSNRDYSIKKDKSTAIRDSDRGVVHSSGVCMTQNNNELTKIAHVTVRSIRKAEIGDKFSSRHGQKGTVGITLPQQDMPFTEKDGIIPDMIVNPHAIPSRMTIGQLIECLQAKACALDGTLGDGTPFFDSEKTDDDNRNKAVDIIGERLKEHGYHEYGKEVMYNPVTGDRFTAEIFIGPTYYQRLKHMVGDKMHSRSVGPLQALTRQPVEGRARDGGLRFGEMERDCMISHGSAAFLKERLFDLSDPFETTICKMCGLIGIWDDNKCSFLCKACRNTVHYSHVKLPYACKLMFQELMAINIAPRIET